MISKYWWFVVGYVCGAITLAAMLLIHHGAPAATKADRIDTFNGRWMPLLPPQIRTDLGAPHCVITACRVV